MSSDRAVRPDTRRRPHRVALALALALSLCLAFTAAEPASAADWRFETLDGTGYLNGRINADVGTANTALLYGGHPHVWYIDAANGDLRHAWWTGSAWWFETLDGHRWGPNGEIDSWIESSSYVSALLYQGLPHVWYYDLTNGNLRHAWWTGRSWHFETLDGIVGPYGRVDGDVGEESAVLLHQGVPHVWYYDYTNGNLRHAWWTGYTWVFQTLDGAGGGYGRAIGNLGRYPCVTLYGNRPHVWYLDVDLGNLRHAWWTGSNWYFETLDGHLWGPNGEIDTYVGSDSTVTLYGGHPHVWYREWTNLRGKLRHAWWTGSAWWFETLDGAGGPNGRTPNSVAIDNAVTLYGGHPHVWYYDFDGLDLRHAWWTGYAWWFETLDGNWTDANGRIAGSLGEDPAVTLYGGQPHVWYYDWANGNLRHAWYA